MKKLTALLIALALFLSLAACSAAPGGADAEAPQDGELLLDAHGNAISSEDAEYVEKAMQLVRREWNSFFKEHSDRDGTVDIINARVIHIKDNDADMFRDVRAVVEFEILSDFYGSAPWYMNAQQYDTVVFKKGRSTELMDIFGMYRSRTFLTDYSDIIESIVDCGSAFNTKKETCSASAEEEKYVAGALEALRSVWADNYAESGGDGTVKILSTRLAVVNDESENVKYERCFSDVSAIVSFELLSDYFGSAPYYSNVMSDACAVFHRDGSVEITGDIPRLAVSATYDSDFSDLFSQVRDFGTAYSDTLRLTR